MKRLKILASALTLLLFCTSAQAGPFRDRLMQRKINDEIKVTRDISYGKADLQKIDVYTAAANKNAPIIFMVHGGGWRRGDKAMPGVAVHKANYWVPRGFVFVSVNNRLLPDADPIRQADDVTTAINFVTKNAAQWGGDGSKIILMGHSAGAHLVALVAARASNSNIRGTVSLDSGVINVPDFMASGRHPDLYDKAFGDDPEFWEAASPYHQLNAGAAPFLIVCSTQRMDACPQGRSFNEKLSSLGGRGEILPLDKSHGEINKELGTDMPYTHAVDQFILKILH